MNISSNLLKSKKIAIIISYLLIIANTLSNLLLTPIYLKYLGLDIYGLYQMVYSVAHYILILDFGISTTMVKYISLYKTQNKKKEEENFSAHCLGIVAALMLFVGIIGSIVNLQLTNIYPSITSEEAGLAHMIFVVMVITIALTILEHYFQGVIMANEYFVIQKTVAFSKVILKILITLIMLWSGLGIVAIVIADLFITVFSLIVLMILSFLKINFKLHFYRFDRALMVSVFTFMVAILLQSIVSYVNNVADKTILGILTTKESVAIYSVALTFITLFNSLPTAISSVFLPQATRMVYNNADRDALTEFVIRSGRYQFMICGAIISGFILFGMEFIQLWTGASTKNAWIVALTIMIPNMIPLVQNTVITILDAKGKRLFRSITLFGISLINILISIILVKKYGMLGAPIGTAISFLFGYGVIMNIYYSKQIGLYVTRMFRSIFSRTWLCILYTMILCISLNILFPHYSWFSLTLKITVFCLIYFVLMFFYGFNNQERIDMMFVFSKFKK